MRSSILRYRFDRPEWIRVTHSPSKMNWKKSYLNFNPITRGFFFLSPFVLFDCLVFYSCRLPARWYAMPLCDRSCARTQCAALLSQRCNFLQSDFMIVEVRPNEWDTRSWKRFMEVNSNIGHNCFRHSAVALSSFDQTISIIKNWERWNVIYAYYVTVFSIRSHSSSHCHSRKDTWTYHFHS